MDREEVSRRLKAGRWLAGTGKLDARGSLRALLNEELAEHELLIENGITTNRLEEIEQLKVTAKPMELEKIAQALGRPGWFEAEKPLEVQTVARALEAFTQHLARLKDDEPPQASP